MIAAVSALLIIVAVGAILIAIGKVTDSHDSQPDVLRGGTIEASPQVQAFSLAIATAEGFGVVGSAPNRAHNPGALIIPGWTGPTTGSEGISVFSSDAEGLQRLVNQLNLIVSGRSKVYTLDDTIETMGQKWTNTDSQNWSLNVANYLGVLPITPLREVLA